MKKIRILQIGMHDQLGGVENFLMNYYRNIDREKIQFDFINMFNNLCFEEEIEELGGKIYKISNVKKNPIKYFKELKKVIKENNYEIVHVHMLSAANILPIIVASKLGVKSIIVHSHSSNVPKSVLKKVLNFFNKKMLIQRANIFLACSAKAGKWLFGGNTKFTIINNAINIEKFEFNDIIRKKIQKEYKLENNLVIGHVGKFEEEKNHKFLIQVFKKIKENNKNAKLLLVGEGTLRMQIEKDVISMGLQEDVIFVGKSYNANEFYQAMDAFVFPSLCEGLGIVLIEAQASGLKCFTAQNNIPKEADISGSVKYIDLNNNPEEWSKNILNTDLTRKENYLKDLDKKYDIKVATQKLEKLYLNL